MAPFQSNLDKVRETPDQSVMHWWVIGYAKVIQGQPKINLLRGVSDHSVMHRCVKLEIAGSTRGRFSNKYPDAIKFGLKNPWPERNVLPGQMSDGVKLIRFSQKNQWPERYALVKGHTGITMGQFAKKLSLAIKFGWKNYWSEHSVSWIKGHLSVILCWQRSILKW